MDDPKIRVRMYRPGLGDCFLVTLTTGTKKSHILIDCGRFNGSKFANIDWPDIVTDIKKECGGKLDAVVITHEHSDHISGFHDNLDDFRLMAKGELWMAWTEDPKQTIATEKKPLTALRETGKRLQAAGNPQMQAIGEGMMEVLGFSPQTDREFEDIKALWPKNRTKLFDPGDVIKRDWLFGVKVHVLGPPKDKKYLNKTVGTAGVEMYKLAGFAAAAGSELVPEAIGMMPFDASYRWQQQHVETATQFQSTFTSYQAESWRKIDTDWLDSVQRMALQYDTSVNNTSLVLAFELPASGKVLLFVGDAQIGNWQSWSTIKYKNPGTSTADLLRQVAFYKCGHHGSHNATLKKGGLEAMPAGIDIAIPTHEAFAIKRRPNPWLMPAVGVDQAMKKRKDKIKRADDPGTKKPFVDFQF